MKQAQPRLDEQGAAFPSDDLSLTLDIVAGSDTPRAIVGYAEKNDVDLIALSTHGRTGFRHLVLGSVAEAVIRHSHIPVLVFPRAVD
jgi:nucleotide-binding universal stress UspA family protein